MLDEIKLPFIYVTDDKKITVKEHVWNGTATRFNVPFFETGLNVNAAIREYVFKFDGTQEARVKVICDELISEDQLGTMVSSMGPWFYTYGHRVEVIKKGDKNLIKLLN